MDDSSKAKRFQFQVLDLLAVMVIVSVLGAAIRFSARYLPSIKDNPPLLGKLISGRIGSGRETGPIS